MPISQEDVELFAESFSQIDDSHVLMDGVYYVGMTIYYLKLTAFTGTALYAGYQTIRIWSL